MIGLVLANLVACQTSEQRVSEAAEKRKVQLDQDLTDFRRVSSSPAFFAGDVAKNEVLLKGEAFILIRNKTTSAKKLPYMYSW